MHRRGAALILAIALLAALMLMGLPFLFIQSASIGGARSLAAQQQARQTVEALAAYGAGIGARSVDGHLGAATAAWSSLADTTLTLGLGATTGGATTPNRIALDLPSTNALAPFGSWIEDEQGKLDACRLGPAGWHKLFTELHIPDWDDSAVHIDQLKSSVYTDIDPYTGTITAHNDGDDYGQLANAVARLICLHGGRLPSFDHLRQADPNIRPYGDRDISANRLFRKPLTSDEIERLRLHITLHALAQTRSGLIDYGSIAMVHPDPNVTGFPFPDNLSLLPDDWVVLDQAGQAKLCFREGSSLITVVTGSHTTVKPDVGGPVFLAPSATINLHQATPAVRHWLGMPAWSGTPVKYRGDMQALWPFTNPWRLTNGVLPQVDTTSMGWFTVEGRVQVLDRVGQILARGHTTRTIQAVPRQGQVERAWFSQGDLEHTSRSRSFGNILTWPNPVQRLSDSTGRALPQDGDHAGSASAFQGAGITSAPIKPTLSGPGNWTAFFGGMIAAPAATVAHASAAIPPLSVGGTAPGDALRPDGLDVGPSGAYLAYRAQTNGPLPPMDPASRPEMAGRVIDLWVRPDSDWSGIVPICDFRSHVDRLGLTLGAATGSWSAPDPASLDRQNHLGLYYDASSLTKPLLVLVYSPPSVERLDPYGPFLSSDEFTTPLIDERCFGSATRSAQMIQPQLAKAPSGLWKTQAFSFLWQPNRILHCFATPGGLVKGQWYHIQTVLGNGRPGNMTLVVDGCAGRQVNNVAAGTSYTMQWGDQCTLPAVVLGEELPAIAATTATVVGPESSYHHNITAKLPAIVTDKVPTLSVSDVIPSRGCLLVDDEHIRYESIDASGTLQNISRGARQRTRIGDVDAFRWRPGSQKHIAGTPMLADGTRIRDTGGMLLTGSATLAADVFPGVNAEFMATFVAPGPGDLHAGTISVSMSPTDAQWPTKGVLSTASKGYFFFTRSGTSLTLYRMDSLDSGGSASSSSLVGMPSTLANGNPGHLTQHLPSTYNIPDVIDFKLASIEVTPTGPHSPVDNGAFAYPGYDSVGNALNAPMVQIVNRDKIEWIRYSLVVKCPNPQTPTAPGSFYLVSLGGFGRTHRGCCRTWWPGDPLPPATIVSPSPTVSHAAGSLVVPVQNAPLGSLITYRGHSLQPGDLATLIPRETSTGAQALALPVRFVAGDGFLAPSDTVIPVGYPRNELNNLRGAFAFDRGIATHPAWTSWSLFYPSTTCALDLSKMEIVVGSAWSSADDLSTQDPYTQPSSYLPRIDYQDGSVASSDGGMYLGSTRPDPSGYANPATRQAMTIDALQTRAWINHTGGMTSAMSNVIRWIAGSSGSYSVTSSISQITPVNPSVEVYAALSSPIKADTNSESGLILINGEVFAWQTAAATAAAVAGVINEPFDRTAVNIPNTIIRLIGRGLLGSERRIHTIGENAPAIITDGKGHRPGLWALMLPFGPLGIVKAIAPASSSTGEWWELANGTPIANITSSAPLPAPTVTKPGRWQGFPLGLTLVTKAEPSATDQPEIISLSMNPWDPFDASANINNPNYHCYMPSEWLRGLYRTQRMTWVQDMTLVIPWQPRYPSALPTSATAATWDQAMRSRQFAWAGFALRMHDIRFDDNAPPSIEISDDPLLTIINDAATSTMQTEVFFLARKLTAPADPLIQTWPPAPGKTASALGGLFASSSYDQQTPTDGGELRVVWRYTSSLSASTQAELYRQLAEGANRTPAIGTRTTAGVASPAVRLRGYAPCTTLAVEDAR